MKKSFLVFVLIFASAALYAKPQKKPNNPTTKNKQTSTATETSEQQMAKALAKLNAKNSALNQMNSSKLNKPPTWIGNDGAFTSANALKYKQPFEVTQGYKPAPPQK